MANISTLTVSLVAETAKFTNDLKKSKTAAAAWGKAVSRAMGGVVVGIGAATVALTALTRESFKVVDQQQKMASRLGLTQAALAGLALAGEQTGTTQRNLQLAMQRSTRRISEAAQGTGTAVKALKELGVSADELSRLSPDEAFIKLAGAFKNVESQSDKVRLAFKLFDSEGVGLVNTLKLGEDGIRAFIQEAKDLGIALERNQTRAIEESNDAVNILKKSFQGLGSQIAARVAPAIEDAALAIANIVKRVTAAIPKFTAWAAAIFGVRRELENLSLADINQEIIQQDKIVNEALGNLNRQLEYFREQGRRGDVRFDTEEEIQNLPIIIRLQQKWNDETQRWNDIVAQRRALRAGDQVDIPGIGDDGTDAIDKQRQQYESLVRTFGTASQKLQLELTRIREVAAANPLIDAELVRAQTQAAIDAYIEEIGRVGAENKRILDLQKAQADAAREAVASPLEKLVAKIAEIRENLATNPFWDPELARKQAAAAVDAYNEEMDRIGEKNRETAEEMTEFQRRAFSNMQDILSEFLFDPFEKGLDGMLKSFIDMLRKMVAQLLAQKILTSFFKYMGIPTDTPTIPQTTGNAIGIGRADMRGRVVGEFGPELFMPGASGSIRPLGAVTVEQQNTFGGGDSLNVATLIPILEENNKKVKAEILDAFDRGSFN